MEMMNLNATRITDQFKDKGFFDNPIHIKAKKDFQFLCAQTGYAALNNINYVSVKTIIADKYVGEFLPLGYNTKSKSLNFPKAIFNADKPDNQVAVVAYNAYDEVIDVFLFAAEMFKKGGLFSIVKSNKDDTYTVHVGDAVGSKLKQYSFGYVLKNLNTK